jgi:hypothetical protein
VRPLQTLMSTTSMMGDASLDEGRHWKPPPKGQSAVRVDDLRGGGRETCRAALLASPSRVPMRLNGCGILCGGS